MADAGDTLNDNEFFADIVDTPKEGIEQHKKREELKSVMHKGKANWLGHKWTHGGGQGKQRGHKQNVRRIQPAWTERKRWKNGKNLGKHVINLSSTGISRWLKIKDVKKIRHDIENDPVIKDQMANLGCLFEFTFGDYLAPVLIDAHTANNVDFVGEPEDEGYESEA